VDRFIQKPDGTWAVQVSKRGREVLRDAMVNKGTAFTNEEREALGLRGLLPAGVATVEQQESRIADALDRLDSPLQRYVELADLHDRNETLFYRLLSSRPRQLLPIVYTPTVGEASQNFSHIFRRARGRWISPKHRGQIADALYQVQADIRLIVVTDNERILGLGDQGAGGMTIPIGKLALYTAGAGIHPSLTLPISLDVGTDNQELLADPMYLGWRHPRLRGQEYYDFVEEFVEAVRTVFPQAVLQWEDFKKGNAFTLLHRYRDRLVSFNDDIQGTAAVTVAGVIAGCRKLGQRLRDQRVLIMGAGAAGVGIAELLRTIMQREGLAGDDLMRSIAMIDTGGLLLESRDVADRHKHPYLWPVEMAREIGLEPDPAPMLEQVAGAYKPTVMIGTTGQPGIFTEAIVHEIADHVERPMVFPLSNPTSKSEAVPADLIAWTGGRVLIATGSPFKPVEYDRHTFRISQGNNVYIFPGVGLGALAVGATSIVDSMFAAAATRLAEIVTAEQLDEGRLYPPIDDLRPVTRQVAEAVARDAIAAGVAQEPEEGVSAAIERWIWDPVYPAIQAV